MPDRRASPELRERAGTGRVRISARIVESGQSATRELTLGQPLGLATGSLTLAEVQPATRADQPIAPADYRFTFRFERDQ